MTGAGIPIRYAGRTFRGRHALAIHLAGITGRTSTACVQALKRMGDDAVRVVDYYRALDATAPLIGRSHSFVVAKLCEFGNDADAVVQHFRQADDTSSLGALAQEFRQALQDGGFSRWDELTVLTSDRDPYRFDNPTGRIKAQWFANVIARFVPDGAVHLRGLHYRLVSSTALVLKPDGTPYRNKNEDWVWLMDDASAGRWLGLVPFELNLDERNDPPVLPDDDDPGIAGMWPELLKGVRLGTPGLADAMPNIEWTIRPERQPYRIILYGEKSSLAPVLRPIRDKVNGELLLPTGESTTTMVFNLAQRCVADGRPAVILYFSDFDPSGWQMTISIARKLQALKTLRFPTLDVRLYPVALTYEQVSRLSLPSTPLKDTEKRAEKWRAAWNHEQTEIDALEALKPAVLTQLAEDFVRPFFDPTLARRTAAVVRRSQDTAAATLAAHPQYQVARAAIVEALERLDAANGDLETAQEAAMADLEDIGLPALLTLPQPRIKAAAPEPLFTTDDDYVTASLRLKRHRALYPDADDEAE